MRSDAIPPTKIDLEEITGSVVPRKFPPGIELALHPHEKTKSHNTLDMQFVFQGFKAFLGPKNSYWPQQINTSW